MTSIDNSLSISESDQTRSRKIKDLVVRAIESADEQVIGFDEYMKIALYTPDLGYYDAGKEIFGSDGDFVTAPSSGELFSKCITNEIKSILSSLGRDIFEYGAGNGDLIKDICNQLENDSVFCDFIYHVIEPNRSLREKQKAITCDLSAKMVWHEHVPTSIPNGVVIANEVLDAMPAVKYVVNQGSIEEMGVGYSAPDLVWKKKTSDIPVDLTHSLKNHESGYETERVFGLDIWLGSIFESSDRVVLLIVDYGYSEAEFLKPDRRYGTLKCHFRHTMNDDPFLLPGLQDITTSVNYTDLARCATDVGFEVLGYTTQERFLAGNKIDSFFAQALEENVVDQYRLAQEAKRLLLPSEMGHYMKVMALGKNFSGSLNGFESDESFRL